MQAIGMESTIFGGESRGAKGTKSFWKTTAFRGERKCKGQYGVDMSCEYKGILFVISSVGVEELGKQPNQPGSVALENNLKNSNA